MSQKASKRLIYVGGPTASGKTSVAMELATWLNTEIISCDSRQFYEELKIGAAPPTSLELDSVKHHFIQDRSVSEPLTAGQFEGEGMRKVEQLFMQFDDVVLVGGSGLFANALLYGFDDLPEANPAYRSELDDILKVNGLSALQQMLKESDPEYYNVVDIQNPHRVIRALEIIQAAGTTYTELRSKSKRQRKFETLIFIMDLPRQELYNRINERVDMMVAAGLAEEARYLLSMAHLQPLNTVGYKEWFAHFKGELSREETIALIKQNTRRFAKRQLTWFRRYEDAHWVNPENIEDMKRIVQRLNTDEKA